MKGISDRILEECSALRDGFNAHPFVLGIADGSLEVQKFEYFMLQDYLYLIEYAKVFAIGAAKAEDPVIVRAFANYISNIQNSEMDIHRTYMARLGIDLNEAEGSWRSQDNISYTSYMLRIAYECGPAEICAAILPCAVSYEEIASKMVRDYPSCVNNEFYGGWIRGYASEEYHKENIELTELTERAASGYSEIRINKLIEIAKRCCLYEKAFWDMSWEMREI